MTGTVHSVDHTTGWLQVKTSEAMLKLHFPADAVRELNNGDRITVGMGYSKES